MKQRHPQARVACPILGQSGSHPRIPPSVICALRRPCDDAGRSVQLTCGREVVMGLVQSDVEHPGWGWGSRAPVAELAGVSGRHHELFALGLYRDPDADPELIAACPLVLAFWRGRPGGLMEGQSETDLAEWRAYSPQRRPLPLPDQFEALLHAAHHGRLSREDEVLRECRLQAVVRAHGTDGPQHGAVDHAGRRTSCRSRPSTSRSRPAER